MTDGTKIRIGTRKSRLALWQAEAARTALSSRFPDIEFEIVKISSHGDSDLTTSLGNMSMTGIFTTRLEEALRRKEVDVAVHSLKDVPTQLDEGFVLAAMLPREDARDALIGKGAVAIAELPRNAVVATGSIRRRSQILISRPDIRFAEMRGNVETRLRKLADTDEWSATVMALAGLKRIGLEDRVSAPLELNEMVPAPAQGVIGIECREDDRAVRDLLAGVDDRAARLAATAERALMRRLEGGCHVPIGAYATIADGTISLEAVVAAVDGSSSVRASHSASSADPAGVGIALAEELISRGADQILAEIRGGGEGS